jgi:hypothetical protein
MKQLRLTISLLIVISGITYGQSIVHPWKVVDNGGGISTAGDLTLQTSIGQSAVQVMSEAGVNLESGYIPGVRFLSGASTTIVHAVEANWNLISVPLIPMNEDYLKTTLYPTAVSRAFAYSNGYLPKDTLKNGVGYWLKFSDAESIPISGKSLPAEDTIDVSARWNIIGTLTYPVLVSDVTPVPPVTITTPFFGYSSVSGYFTEDTLQPGSAYWVKVSQDGKLVLKSGSVLVSSKLSALVSKSTDKPRGLASVQNIPEGMNKLLLKDGRGNERSLYFSSRNPDVELDKFELPPLPPAGIMDVRYASQRSLEVAESGKEKEVAIIISSAAYPLTIEWNIDHPSEATLLIDGKKILMNRSGETQITNPASQIKLRFSPASTVEIPKEFALQQNYPNPFNPVTKIHYDLPKDSKVTLKIYNLLGEEVRTVVDEVQTAGYKVVEVNSDALPSGVYFYRLQAQSAETNFTDIKKMLLMK